MNAFGDKVAFNPNNMKRTSRKSSRSPINPVELRNSNFGKSSIHGGHSDTCDNHKGVSPRTPKRALDILNVPRQSRSPSPRSFGSNKLNRQSNVSSPQPTPKSTPRTPYSGSPYIPKSHGRPKAKQDRQYETTIAKKKERIPSARSRRLYRDEFFFSDGFTESSEEWVSPKPKRKSKQKDKSVKEKKTKIVPNILTTAKAVNKFLGHARDNSNNVDDDTKYSDPSDPWGPNSPMRRIKNMEDNYKDVDEYTASDKELEEKILEEAEQCNEGTKEETLLEDDSKDHGNENAPTSNAALAEIEETQETELEERNVKSEFQTTYFEPSAQEITHDQLLLEVQDLNDDKDSAIELSARESTPSSPEKDIECVKISASLDFPAVDEEKPSKDSKKEWKFIPVPGSSPQLLGHILDDESGEMFAVYSDVASGDQDKQSESSKEEDIPWCSFYFLVRIFGLFVLAGCLVGMILLAQA